jgi:hypothetical protein
MLTTSMMLETGGLERYKTAHVTLAQFLVLCYVSTGIKCNSCITVGLSVGEPDSLVPDFLVLLQVRVCSGCIVALIARKPLRPRGPGGVTAA